MGRNNTVATVVEHCVSKPSVPQPPRRHLRTLPGAGFRSHVDGPRHEAGIQRPRQFLYEGLVGVGVRAPQLKVHVGQRQRIPLGVE